MFGKFGIHPYPILSSACDGSPGLSCAGGKSAGKALHLGVIFPAENPAGFLQKFPENQAGNTLTRFTALLDRLRPRVINEPIVLGE